MEVQTIFGDFAGPSQSKVQLELESGLSTGPPSPSLSRQNIKGAFPGRGRYLP